MNKESLEKRLVEPLTKLYVNHINQTETIIRCDNISINFWAMERNSLLKNEPPKVLKKKHLEWQYKLKEINKHLDDLYKSRKDTMKDVEDLKTNFS